MKNSLDVIIKKHQDINVLIFEINNYVKILKTVFASEQNDYSFVDPLITLLRHKINSLNQKSESLHTKLIQHKFNLSK